MTGRCLTELAVINRVTLTHRPTLHWLVHATNTLPVGETFSVLEVGDGGGDLLRAIARLADRRGLKAQLSGIDLNPRSAIAARAATPPGMTIDYQTADVFAYTPAAPVDFIVSSQPTNHLSDREVVEFLIWLEANSVYGWHIADLHRHALTYHRVAVLCRLMGWHRIIRSDGMISIARSFRRREWQAKVSWHMAFRFCVSRMK